MTADNRDQPGNKKSSTVTCWQCIHDWSPEQTIPDLLLLGWDGDLARPSEDFLCTFCGCFGTGVRSDIAGIVDLVGGSIFVRLWYLCDDMYVSWFGRSMYIYPWPWTVAKYDRVTFERLPLWEVNYAGYFFFIPDCICDFNGSTKRFLYRHIWHIADSLQELQRQTDYTTLLTTDSSTFMLRENAISNQPGLYHASGAWWHWQRSLKPKHGLYIMTLRHTDHVYRVPARAIIEAWWQLGIVKVILRGLSILDWLDLKYHGLLEFADGAVTPHDRPNAPKLLHHIRPLCLSW